MCTAGMTRWELMLGWVGYGWSLLPGVAGCVWLRCAFQVFWKKLFSASRSSEASCEGHEDTYFDVVAPFFCLSTDITRVCNV